MRQMKLVSLCCLEKRKSILGLNLGRSTRIHHAEISDCFDMDPCTPRFALQWTTTGSTAHIYAFVPHGSWCMPDAWRIPVYAAQWITGIMCKTNEHLHLKTRPCAGDKVHFTAALNTGRSISSSICMLARTQTREIHNIGGDILLHIH